VSWIYGVFLGEKTRKLLAERGVAELNTVSQVPEVGVTVSVLSVHLSP
jgi:hypothetical protein